jgi:conjugal transfer/entry exclusion protein
MYSTTIFILIGVILFALGALVGAFIYNLIVHGFSNHLEKQLDKSIKNYEHYVLEKATNSIDAFENIKYQLNNISTNIIKEQKTIYQATCTISTDITLFSRELKASQEIRVSLENEIVKLKNIINRQNRQKKEK